MAESQRPRCPICLRAASSLGTCPREAQQSWRLVPAGDSVPEVARCAPRGEGHTSPWWLPPIFCSPWGSGVGGAHAGSCDLDLGSLKGLALWVSLAVFADGLVLGDKLFFILWLENRRHWQTPPPPPPPPFCGSRLDYLCLNAPGRRVLWNVLCPAPGNCEALSSGPRECEGQCFPSGWPSAAALPPAGGAGHVAGTELMPHGCDAGFHGKLSKEAAWF